MPIQTIPLIIEPNGVLRTLYDERWDLRALGRLSLCRASHVEPTSNGEWLADLAPVSGPVLGPYSLRSEALAAEQDWLSQHRFCGSAM